MIRRQLVRNSCLYHSYMYHPIYNRYYFSANGYLIQYIQERIPLTSYIVKWSCGYFVCLYDSIYPSQFFLGYRHILLAIEITRK